MNVLEDSKYIKIELDIGNVYQFVNPMLNSNMFIIVNADEALIVDPFISSDAMELLINLQIRKIISVITHEHLDHISGVNFFRRDGWNYQVFSHKIAKKLINNPYKNLSEYYQVLFPDIDIGNLPSYYLIDFTFENKYDFQFIRTNISLIHTPGHSEGSICVCIDSKFIFTGDSLVDGNKTITSFPGGKKKQFVDITIPILNSFNSDCLVFPGHGSVKKLSDYSLEF